MTPEDAEIDATLDEAIETVLDAHEMPFPMSVSASPVTETYFFQEGAPFDNQLRGLPDTDEIVQLLRRSRQIRVNLRADLEAELAIEREKAGY